MRKLILLSVFCLITFKLFSQNKDLLGVSLRSDLDQEPFNSWYQANYANYKPDPVTLEKLSQLKLKDYHIEIYFGTWCPDTRRELPRFLKIIDLIGFHEDKIKFIGVDRGDNYKQGPEGETIGKGIYRVATFIIYKNGKEVNRITEHPVLTLELDLLNILTTNTYTSNYPSFSIIDGWLKEGILSNDNISLWGMAKHLKPLVTTPSELSACGRVLQTQNMVKEGTAIHKMNTFIFHDSPSAYVGLAWALAKEENYADAIKNLEYALKIDDDESNISSTLDTYYKFRSAMEEDKTVN